MIRVNDQNRKALNERLVATISDCEEVMMIKLVKGISVGILAASLGLVMLPEKPAAAQVKPAKVLATTKIKKTAYHPNGGVLYQTAKLTKKTSWAFKPVKTTFYATKSAKVKKTNGKKVTYYYVKNKQGNLKGWIWKGNLSKTKDLAQRLSDMRRVKAIIKLMPKPAKSTKYETAYDSTNAVIRLFKKMKPADAYKTTIFYPGKGLPDAVTRFSGTTPKEVKTSMTAYDIFKGRFSKKTNQKLAKMQQRLKKAEANSTVAGDDNVYNASFNFMQALSKAITTLK